MAPRVELLWWAGCPSWRGAIALVSEELARAGLDPEQLVVREIRGEDEAASEGFVGSPTILVDGRDIQAPHDQPAGLTCRIYRLRDGRISALPDRADLAAALGAAIEGGDGHDDGV